MTAPRDSAARLQALDPNASFLCEAPAGSGKTELLTRRLLTLLARVERPEAILAITFTRKAAGEMRARVMTALAAATRPAPDDAYMRETWELARAALARDADRGWHLLQNPARLQLRTFDSFAAQLAQSLPLLAQLGGNPQVAEDAAPLYAEAAAQWFASLEAESTGAASGRHLLGHLDNDWQRLEPLLTRLLARRDEWLPVLGASGLDTNSARAALEDSLRAARARLSAELDQMIGPTLARALSGCMAGAAERGGPPAAAPDEPEFWPRVAQFCLTKTGTLRRQLTVREGFPAGKAAAGAKAEARELLARVEEITGAIAALAATAYWPPECYEDADWQTLGALAESLPRLAAHLQVVFASHAAIDYVELTQRALLALGPEDEPTDLALRLDYQIQHILVDEFQDTSKTQYALLARLTAGWAPDDGRTLFCVGDAMQSIYSFRGARVGLFLQSQEHGVGELPLETLRLTTNFRAAAPLVDWLNQTFAQAFPARANAERGAVPLARAEAFGATTSTGASVHYHSLPALRPSAWEATAVARQVAAIRAGDPAASIGVLVRSRTHAAPIARALRAAGLCFQAVDLEPLAAVPAVSDLTALTKALCWPGQRIAWLALLRAPLVGLCLADLEVVASAPGGPWVLAQARTALSLPSLSEDGARRLTRVVPLLETAVADRARQPLRQWLEGAWLALGGAACLADAGAAEQTRRYFDWLEARAARGAEHSPEALSRDLAALYAAPDPAADGSLVLMTMHKAKGLEFDAVLLPGLYRAPRASDKALLLLQESLLGHELLLAPLHPHGGDKNPIYAHLAYELHERARLEACRLLYVACTRARRQLHIFAPAEPGTDGGELRAPPAAALLSHIWPALASAFTPFTAPATVAPPTAEPERVAPPPLERLPVDFSAPAAPTSPLAEFVPFYKFANSTEDLPRYDRARLRDRACDQTLLSAARVLARGGCWGPGAARAQLLEAGLLPAELEGACQAVLERLEPWRHCPVFAELRQQALLIDAPAALAAHGEYLRVDLLVAQPAGQLLAICFDAAPAANGSARLRAREENLRVIARAVAAARKSHVKSALLPVGSSVWLEGPSAVPADAIG